MVKRRVAKRNGKPTFYWAIEGYDSTKKIFSRKFKTTLISDRQIEPLLKALTARAGLTLKEIIGCYMMLLIPSPSIGENSSRSAAF